MIKYKSYLGVAQLVARSVRDAEVVSSSLITQTTNPYNHYPELSLFDNPDIFY